MTRTKVGVEGFEHIHHPLCGQTPYWHLPWYRCVEWRRLLGERALRAGTGLSVAMLAVLVVDKLVLGRVVETWLKAHPLVTVPLLAGVAGLYALHMWAKRRTTSPCKARH